MRSGEPEDADHESVVGNADRRGLHTSRVPAVPAAVREHNPGYTAEGDDLSGCGDGLAETPGIGRGLRAGGDSVENRLGKSGITGAVAEVASNLGPPTWTGDGRHGSHPRGDRSDEKIAGLDACRPLDGERRGSTFG